jgi:hypothetical protein
MTETSYEARISQVERCIPVAFSLPGKYLYIGASKNRTSFLEFLKPAQTTILEIYEPNIKNLQSRPEYQDFHFVLGDVRDVEKLFSGGEISNRVDLNKYLFPISPPEPKSFSVVIWYHGPEHVCCEALPKILANLELLANNLVILGCPWGIYEQGCFDGNIHEAHIAALYPEDFQKYGYTVDTLWKKDCQGSNILAWKYLPVALSTQTSEQWKWNLKGDLNFYETQN